MSPTQDILIKIWQDVLKRESIGPDDDFFEVGGDSLLALIIYDRIRQHYGREFLIFDLSKAPSIRAFADLIDAELAGEKNSYRALQRVRKGDAGVPPLFLVHGGDGNARVFQRLSRNLDPRIPVYAFRWPGWDGRPAPKTFSAMARHYIKEMKNFQPEGPYRLGGYCVGGLVALEMARILKQNGEILDPLFIWDTPNVETKSYHRREPWYSSTEYSLFRNMVDKLFAAKRLAQPDCEIPVVPTKFSGAYEVLRRYPSLYTLARLIQIRLGFLLIIYWQLFGRLVPISWRWNYCMATCFLALRRHRANPYSGRVLFLRSDVFLGRPMNMLGWWDDVFMGYGELCTGDFKGHVVGGSHITVLDQPQGAQVVNDIYFDES